MRYALFIGISLTVITVGCRSKSESIGQPVGQTGQAVAMHVPRGDVMAGRHAFLELRCNACHRVEGESFADPVATPDVPVVLGKQQARQSRAQLLESIMAPSCKIPADLPDVRSGTMSRMGDYRSAMTVAQLLDVVEFIQSLDQEARETPRESEQSG